MSRHTHETITHQVIAILGLYSDRDEQQLIKQLIIDNKTFTEAGIDSLDLLDIYFTLEKTYGIRFPQEEWSRLSRDTVHHDSNGMVLHTVPSVVAEVRKQLAAKTEALA